ncbi:MAG: MlaC/ttg2D family ABC transporter substrate-binding protein [Gammaproteobacteria bacterium]
MRDLRRFRWRALTPSLALLVATMPVAAEAPLTPVRATIEAVIATISDESLAAETKRQRALAIIGERFDFDGMTRRVLATHWHRANATQRSEITALFRTLLINAYWSKLATYQGEQVEYVDERLRGTALASVRAVIKTVRAEIPLEFKLELRDERWFAYDVVIEQVSLVRNYRQRFHEVALAEGIDGLIAYLQAQVAVGN